MIAKKRNDDTHATPRSDESDDRGSLRRNVSTPAISDHMANEGLLERLRVLTSDLSDLRNTLSCSIWTGPPSRKRPAETSVGRTASERAKGAVRITIEWERHETEGKRQE